jgi:hypothetical protein
MWERLMDASLLTVGAIVLFAVFTTILFIYERREKNSRKKPAICRPQLRVIRCEKTNRAA